MQRLNYLDDVVVRTPAKVNLFLEVKGKRPDGYHEIATLMVAVRLFDSLIFRADPSGKINLTCTHAELSTGPDNLVIRAAQLLQERTACKQGARVRLVKRIPMAAGLAGGSADAAATLLGLNQLWKLGKSRDELARLGAELGSDVPFFFHTPAAWCTGRGEVVTPLSVPRPLHFLLLCPAFGMPTAAVYSNVELPANPETGETIRQALAQGDIDRIGKLLHNRLAPAAQRLDDRIGRYRQMLADLQPPGQQMSGSGSTLYALCRSAQECVQLGERLRGQASTAEFELILTRSL
jgi:4-diphosphocytidyl-2-C-methyl-D-erythritol kinase